MPQADDRLHEMELRARYAAATNLQEFGDFFLSRFLGLQVGYDAEEQTCTVFLPYARHLGNPQGSVHGGVIATVMDISVGHLCHRLINAGRRLVHLESRMPDTDGRLIAYGAGSWHRHER